ARVAAAQGGTVLLVDSNGSDRWSILEEGTPAATRAWHRHAGQRQDIWSTKAIRLGFASVSGLKEAHAPILMARRGSGYASVRDLWLRTRLPVAALERLAEADAFQSLGLNRRKALWAVRGLIGTDGAETLPLFAQ